MAQTSSNQAQYSIAIAIGVIVGCGFWWIRGLTSGVSAWAGCLVGALNFAALQYIVQQLMRQMDKPSGAAKLGLLFFLKLIALVAVIIMLTTVIGEFDGLAFAFGFLSILVSVTFTVFLSSSEEHRESHGTTPSSGEKAIS